MKTVYIFVCGLLLKVVLSLACIWRWPNQEANIAGQTARDKSNVGHGEDSEEAKSSIPVLREKLQEMAIKTNSITYSIL